MAYIFQIAVQKCYQLKHLYGQLPGKPRQGLFYDLFFARMVESLPQCRGCNTAAVGLVLLLRRN